MRSVFEELGDRIVQTQLVALGQQQNRRGGELFCDRGQSELGTSGARCVLVHAMLAPTALEYNLPPIDRQHGSAGCSGQDRFDFFHNGIIRRLLSGCPVWGPGE